MFMMGEQFTVVDAYVLAIARWCNHPKVMLDLEPDASLGDSLARVGARQAVQEALKAEGLAS